MIATTLLRDKEIRHLKVMQYLEATQFFVWCCAPFLVAVASFATFVLVDPVNNILTSQAEMGSFSKIYLDQRLISLHLFLFLIIHPKVRPLLAGGLHLTHALQHAPGAAPALANCHRFAHPGRQFKRLWAFVGSLCGLFLPCCIKNRTTVVTTA